MLVVVFFFFFAMICDQNLQKILEIIDNQRQILNQDV